MSDELEKKPLHTETFFLPPLKMFLTFLDKEQAEKNPNEETSEKPTEKDVEKLIEKLSEKEE